MAKKTSQDYTDRSSIYEDLTSETSLLNEGRVPGVSDTLEGDVVGDAVPSDVVASGSPVKNPQENVLDFEKKYEELPGEVLLPLLRLFDWTHNLVFSSTDLDTVSWTSGTVRLIDGTTYSIGSGNTGNMAAETFIYLDLDVSKVALQTTTSKALAFGLRKRLIAIAQNGAVESIFVVFNAKELNIDGSNIVPGTVTPNLADRGWSQTPVFSATDADTVAWGAGTFTSTDGTSYSISAGNTGNMAALTFIFLDTGVSSTAYQTATSYTPSSVRVLVAVASNNSDATSKATFQVFGGRGGNLLAVDNLAANSASTNEFISNTAQIANLLVTNAKINDLSVAKLTSGSITSKTVTLAVTDGSGDTYIAAGKTDFVIATNGFILGVDDSDSNLPKFYIGDGTAANTMYFDNGELNIGGFKIQGSLYNILGNGTDGAYTLNAGQAAVSGLFDKSGSTFTLLRDADFTNLTIDATFTLKQNGFIIRCNATITDNGTRHVNGGAGGNAGTGGAINAGSAGAVAHANGTLWGGIAGQAGGAGNSNVGGGNGTAGTAGTAASFALGSNGAAGGSGGAANPPGAAGGGGAGGTATATKSSPHALPFGFMMRDWSDSSIPYLRGGAGAGSGGGGGVQSGDGVSDGSGGGGGSGATGGTMVWVCKTWAGSGTVSATGGNGGNGANASNGNNNGGGGGGGGGHGGMMRGYYNKKTFTGTTSVAGGTGGSGGSPTGFGDGGTAGTNGTAGTFTEVLI